MAGYYRTEYVYPSGDIEDWTSERGWWVISPMVNET